MGDLVKTEDRGTAMEMGDVKLYQNPRKECNR